MADVNSDDVKKGDGQQAATDQPTTPMIPKPRFDEILGRAKTAESEVEKLKAQLAQLQDSQGKQEKTLQQQLSELKSQFEATQTDLKNEQLNSLRLRVAQTMGIPEWANDLAGTDEESIKASAHAIQTRLEATMQTLLEKSQGVGPSWPQGNPVPSATSAQLRDPKWVRENPEKVMAAYQNQ